MSHSSILCFRSTEVRDAYDIERSVSADLNNDLLLLSEQHSMENSTTWAYSIWATSDFQQHSSGLASLNIATSIISAVSVPCKPHPSSCRIRRSDKILITVFISLTIVLHIVSPLSLPVTHADAHLYINTSEIYQSSLNSPMSSLVLGHTPSPSPPMSSASSSSPSHPLLPPTSLDLSLSLLVVLPSHFSTLSYAPISSLYNTEV